jgi:hypothetical protein
MKILISKLALILMLVLFNNSSKAQPGFEDEVEDTPINGATITMVIGLAYGIKKSLNFKNHSKETKTS